MEFGKKMEACRRRSPRQTVMLAGSAMSITRSRSVMVADLSAGGALLGGRDLPSPGDDLVMVVGTQDCMGKVMWRAGDKCGVKLDEFLVDQNIARMKQEAAWDSVTGWER